MNNNQVTKHIITHIELTRIHSETYKRPDDTTFHCVFSFFTKNTITSAIPAFQKRHSFNLMKSLKITLQQDRQ